ncbi:hypothetical protein DAEQUDRAFT_312611 [Daedalea quercina L-15889]|uniref:Uncharacterized protein n=1 Tax=Daedalea quercina L-15889 TaxID=1314783 RepID=A0A165Q0B0_9APHY|nr:hypothetical protein DAEQUDRAFT_312611 [Daedalea quercina L-15889]
MFSEVLPSVVVSHHYDLHWPAVPIISIGTRGNVSGHHIRVTTSLDPVRLTHVLVSLGMNGRIDTCTALQISLWPRSLDSLYVSAYCTPSLDHFYMTTSDADQTPRRHQYSSCVLAGVCRRSPRDMGNKL